MEVARYKSRPRLRPHTCRHGQRHFRTRRRPSSFLKIAVVEPARPLHSRSTSSPRSSLRGEEGTLFDRGEGKKRGKPREKYGMSRMGKRCIEDVILYGVVTHRPTWKEQYGNLSRNLSSWRKEGFREDIYTKQEIICLNYLGKIGKEY